MPEASMVTESAIADAKVRDFYELLKPRVMTLVTFTAFVGLYSTYEPLHPFIAFVAILCIAIGVVPLAH